jgi:6-phosphogluconolactonase
MMRESDESYAYIGCWDMYKSGAGNGFGICRYHADSGALELIKTAFPQITVGAACRDPKRNILYCTNESATLPGYFRGGGGQVYALAIDARSGELTEINHRPSYGSLPSDVAIDASSEHLIVTHHTGREPVTTIALDAAGKYRIRLCYDDATTVLFPLNPDGSIAEPCDVYKHSGAGGPLARQTHPQLHSVTRSPSGELFAVCDKGNDEIVMFRIDRPAGGAATLTGCGRAKTAPGSSPRYSAFHPTRPFLFVNHETMAQVASLGYQPDGQLQPLYLTNALPEGCEDDAEMKQSDIALHPSGRFLYSLIRGIHAVSVFSIDEATGALDRIATVTLDGQGPRGCAISPDGRFMHIAAFSSNEVLCWAIGADGMLTPTRQKLALPNPGSVVFSNA